MCQKTLHIALFFAIFLLFHSGTKVKASAKTKKQTIRQFHRSIPLIDLHADTMYHLTRRWYNFRKHQPRKDLDLPRMRRSGIGAQVFVLWVPPKVMKRNKRKGWLYLKRMHRNFRKLLKQCRGALVHARTQEDVKRIIAQGKIAALLAIEGVHPFGGSLKRAKEAIGWGLTYVGLTWNNSNAFATSGKDEWKKRVKHGLTAKGRKLVRLLEKHRVLVDLSHASRKTFWDVDRIAKRPYIASHSNSFALRPHYRNLTNRQLKAIGRVGGVVGLVFYTAYLVRGHHHRKIGLKPLFRHLKHLLRYAGVKSVGIGSDFDGLISKPKGLKHIARLPYLTKKLRRQGYTKKQLRGILGGNVFRLLPKK